MIGKSGQETIEKWVADGMSYQEARGKWYSIMHAPLPELVRNSIQVIGMDELKKLNKMPENTRIKIEGGF